MRESFVLYKSFYEPIKGLRSEDKGDLLDAIFIFQIQGIEPPNTSRIYMAFLFFKNQFRLDNEKYLSVVERNKTNGIKGGRPTKQETQINPNNPVGFQEPKKPDNDNDNDNDKDKDKNKDLKIVVTPQHPLQKFILDNYPNVSKLKKQLTISECEKIVSSFDRHRIAEILNDMENKADLNRKYVSVYLTLLKWLKNDFSKKGQNLSNGTSKIEGMVGSFHEAMEILKNNNTE